MRGLRFSNDLEVLRSEVARELSRVRPTELRAVRSTPWSSNTTTCDAVTCSISRPGSGSGRFFGEPLLVEMLFCPLMFYGSAREHDMDWGQFSIMFRSIFLEGLGRRPHAGVRLILRKQLVRKFRGLGGELKLRAGCRADWWLRTAGSTGVVLEVGESGWRAGAGALLGRVVRDDAALRRRSARWRSPPRADARGG